MKSFFIGLILCPFLTLRCFSFEPIQAPTGKLTETLTLCRSCHNFIQKATAQKSGPTLFAVYGRKAGNLSDYEYSPTLKQADFIWDDQHLDDFLRKPHRFQIKTAMPFPGIQEKLLRKQVIDYLKSITPLKQPSFTEALNAGNSDRGQRLFTPCQTCHPVRSYQHIGIGPNLYGVVGRKIASYPGYNYSPYLLEKTGTWTPENLNKYFIVRKGVTQGIHLAHKKLDTQQKRADIIRYLLTLSPNKDAPKDD